MTFCLLRWIDYRKKRSETRVRDEARVLTLPLLRLAVSVRLWGSRVFPEIVGVVG